MVIASGTEGKREFLLLGLTAENVKMLVAGKPIRCTSHTHPGVPPNLSLCICYGDTEQAIYDELEGLGALQGAIVKKDPRL